MKNQWHLTAVAEMQDIINQLMDEELKTTQDLRDRLQKSSALWEQVAGENEVEISGLSFPVDQS